MPNSTVFSGVKITWLGHASIMLEGDGLRFYVDPYVLPKASLPSDCILYTHGHPDHCVSAPSITTARTTVICHGCKLPGRVIEIGGTEKIGPVSIEAVHAYNVSRPFHKKGDGAGFILKFKAARIYVAGDTDVIPEMDGYKCVVAIVPIGGTYTMDSTEASNAIARIAPKVAIPYHFNYLSDTRASPADFQKMVEEKTGRKTVARILSP